MNPTTESGDGAIVPYTTSEETPPQDTTSYRVDYRYRKIANIVDDGYGQIALTGKWRKSHVVIETLSVLSAWNKAETAIRSKHPACEFAIIKVIRLDAQRGESEAAK